MSQFPFKPIPWTSADSSAAPALQTSGERVTWVPMIRCPAVFPVELFETAISQLVHHPEYNSTLILRSEQISETRAQFETIPSIPQIVGFSPRWSIHRRLLPRRPGRDASLEQQCTLYGEIVTEENISSQADIPPPTILTLTPILEAGASLPYYHPRVSHLAFRYITSTQPFIQIEVVPLPNTPLDVDSRLYRTCLALLETLHRYGWGALIHYKKRVIHDCIVPREPYQDLYLVMRERHKHLVNEWHEVTDPLKHVFEDIGIATFLMLLWKDMYATKSSGEDDTYELQDDAEPWRRWPRPPAGFVDLGCGNGLLVHILVSEGYEGHGLDLRARTSWQHYANSTQEHLHVKALDPTISSSQHSTDPYLRQGVFLIGNHADELTPWIPVLSTLCSASGYISIPCCSWTFDARYERSKSKPFPIETSLDDFTDALNLGGEGNNASAYSMYRIWLATLSHHCGWKVETETLRIPSTRNWALVGRERICKSETQRGESIQHALEIIERVRETGIFKTRTPEGKGTDH